ncbi:MAG: hypothetical protein PHP62_04495 [Candidatus Moranbacteria bacterium]|nr:hypothetical protein [Candidatus Moranbacteria bacterium]
MEGSYGGATRFNIEGIKERASIKDCELVLKSGYSSRIDLDAFRDIYPGAEVDRDKQWAEGLKKKLAERDRLEGKELVYAAIRSDALETLIVDQAEMNNWFGENSFLTRTSEYDDKNNHVDAILEFAVEGEDGEVAKRLALAIDTTMASSKSNNVVNDNIEKNIEAVKYDRTTVKYFESQVDNYKGRLRHVLPVVVGVDMTNSDDLISLAASMAKLESTIRDPKAIVNKENLKINLTKAKKEMLDHPAQLLFLEEIKAQLEMYAGLGIYKDNEQLMSILETINGVLDDKQDLAERTICHDMKRNDRTYNQIIDKCQTRLDAR